MAGLFATSANLVTALTAAAPGPFGAVTLTAGGAITVNSAAGPAGNNTISFANGTGQSYVTLPSVIASPNGTAIGFGCQFAGTPVLTTAILALTSSTNIFLRVNSGTGTVSFVDASSTVTTGAALSAGSRHYLEIYVPTFAASQTVTIMLDGVVYLTVTGANCNVSGYPVTATIGSQTTNGAFSWTADSIYMCDTTGPQNNYILGLGTSTVVVDGIAAAPGQFSQFTPTGAATNWQCMDTIPPPGDTTYGADATAGDQVAVAIGAISSLGSVKFVNIEADVRQEVSAGGRSFAVGVGNGSNVSYGTTRTPTTTYTIYNQAFDTNPNVSAPWTVANLATLQPAIKTIS